MYISVVSVRTPRTGLSYAVSLLCVSQLSAVCSSRVSNNITVTHPHGETLKMHDLTLTDLVGPCIGIGAGGR